MSCTELLKYSGPKEHMKFALNSKINWKKIKIKFKMNYFFLTKMNKNYN
jgi:hypothetical protein